MSFYYNVARAQDEARAALRVLDGYDPAQHPQSPANHALLEQARSVIDPGAIADALHALYDAPYERVPLDRAFAVREAVQLLKDSTWDLTRFGKGGAFDVPDVLAARQHIQAGVDLLQRARW